MLKLNESLNKKNDSDRFNYLLATNCIPSQLKYAIERAENQKYLSAELFYELLEILNSLDDPFYEEYKSFISKLNTSKYVAIFANANFFLNRRSVW